MVPFSWVCKRLDTATGGTLGNVLATSTDTSPLRLETGAGEAGGSVCGNAGPL